MLVLISSLCFDACLGFSFAAAISSLFAGVPSNPPVSVFCVVSAEVTLLFCCTEPVVSGLSAAFALDSDVALVSPAWVSST